MLVFCFNCDYACVKGNEAGGERGGLEVHLASLTHGPQASEALSFIGGHWALRSAGRTGSAHLPGHHEGFRPYPGTASMTGGGALGSGPPTKVAQGALGGEQQPGDGL